MVKKYVKKPIPIEAIQYNGENFDELQAFAGNNIYKNEEGIFIHTLEGELKMVNMAGYYLIKGVRGEFYFCEKAIFEETYELVNCN